ncbi:MAG: ABC transporter permease, partial [Acidovorax sp.]
MSTTTTPTLPASAIPGRGIAAWWQAAPFTLQSYADIFKGCGIGGGGDLCVTLKTYGSTLKFSFLVWLITAV